MTVLEQPDLFGEWDAEQESKTEQEAVLEVMRQPATCDRCGTDEPNGFLLQNNHGVDPVTGLISDWPRGEHPIYGERCVAQDLVRAHLIFAVRQGHDLTRETRRAQEHGLEPKPIIALAEAELPGLCVGCRHNRRADGSKFCWDSCQKRYEERTGS